MYWYTILIRNLHQYIYISNIYQAFDVLHCHDILICVRFTVGCTNDNLSVI